MATDTTLRPEEHKFSEVHDGNDYYYRCTCGESVSTTMGEVLHHAKVAGAWIKGLEDERAELLAELREAYSYLEQCCRESNDPGSGPLAWLYRQRERQGG